MVRLSIALQRPNAIRKQRGSRFDEMIVEQYMVFVPLRMSTIDWISLNHSLWKRFFYSLYGYAIEKCVCVCVSVERIINIHERRQLWTQKTNGRPTKKCVEKSFEFVFFFRKSTEWIKIAFLANIFSARRKFFTFVLALSPACPPQFHMMDKFHWAGFFSVRFDYFIIFLVHAVS